MKVMLVAPDEREGLGGGQARAGRLLAASLSGDRRVAFRHVVVPHQFAAKGRLHAAALRVRFHLDHLWCLMRLRPQVVHYFAPCHPMGFLEKAALAAIARLLGARTLVNFRSDLRQYFNIFSPRTCRMFLLALRCFSGAICQFSGLGTFLTVRCGFPDHMVFVVPNAVAPRAVQLDDDVLDRRFHDRRVIFIGSLRERKGVDTLIDATDLLRDRAWLRHPVDIVGEVESDDTYAALLARRERLGLESTVIFHGPKFGLEKLGLLDRSAVLVLASRTEGFPNVVLEGLQAGVPVVLADSGAATDIADAFGSVVRVIEAGAPLAVADAIEALLTDPEEYRKMARTASRFSLDYQPDRIKDRFVAAYALAMR